jgi:hypothetical protein
MFSAVTSCHSLDSIFIRSWQFSFHVTSSTLFTNNLIGHYIACKYVSKYCLLRELAPHAVFTPIWRVLTYVCLEHLCGCVIPRVANLTEEKSLVLNEISGMGILRPII